MKCDNAFSPKFRLCEFESSIAYIAIQDVSGSIISTGGLNIEKLLDNAQTARSVAGFNEADSLDLEELFEVECECFIPAAYIWSEI